MTFKVWTVFLLMETSLCLSPGPAVLLVLAQGLSRGAIASIWSNVGILAANALYFALSATGIATLFLNSTVLFVALSIVGGGYTAWLGIRAFISSDSVLALQSGTAEPIGRRRVFLNGFILQASKPGLLVYFVAVLPQFITTHASVARQVAVLGITSIAVEFMVLLAYGVLASHLSRYATSPRFVRFANRLAGVMLLIAAVSLMMQRIR